MKFAPDPQVQSVGECRVSLALNIVAHTVSTALKVSNQWRTQEFFSRGRGVQQIQLRTEDREDGDLGAVAP